MAGAGSSGWYGIFLSEVANRVNRTQVGMATGGALFFIYLAVVTGPLLVWSTIALTNSYLPSFGFIVSCSLAAIILYWKVWD